MDTRALFGMGLGELTEWLAGMGEKPYRARQVFEALYMQRVMAAVCGVTAGRWLKAKRSPAGGAG